MPGIRVKENEPFEVAIRRFKRTIEKLGLLTNPQKIILQGELAQHIDSYREKRREATGGMEWPF